MKEFSCNVAGKEIKIETGLFAQQASGSVTVRMGDTVVLATAVMAAKPREDVDFFPLMVDYEEKYYASGKIKTSRFMKKEGRPSDEAVTNARLIDRSIRPIFDQSIQNDIQVIINVLSYDEENDPDILGVIGASAAIAISNIPYKVAVAGIRVSLENDQFTINPTHTERENGILDLVVSVTSEGKVIMLESGSHEVSEEKYISAINEAVAAAKPITDIIEQMRIEIGKEKTTIDQPEENPDMVNDVKDFIDSKVREVLFTETPDRKKKFYLLSDDCADSLLEKYGEDSKSAIKSIYFKEAEDLIMQEIMKSDRRIGDRTLTEIRPLDSKVSLLPRTHGSGLFKRGETQVLTVATLGGPGDELIVESMEEETKRRFMHHYNFPPFSVGETQPLRGPSRRDIGHGALAEKALDPVIPEKEKFPYTVRLVSEVLSSNGSSSMASTCGSTLALMDAGVPIKSPVAGIAMGLAQDDQGNFKILTDLQDLEDSEGGMDFKVAGTKDGITAVQMDTKTLGLSGDMVSQTFSQAKEARLEILQNMSGAIAKSRPELSKFAPRLVTWKISTEKIKDVIGPGGKMINEIIDNTGVKIDIDNDGQVTVTSNDAAATDKAVKWIKDLTREVVAGEVFTGKVSRVMNFGVFVEILPNVEGLIHVSKFRNLRGKRIEDVFSISDIIEVKVEEIDSQGRINLIPNKK